MTKAVENKITKAKNEEVIIVLSFYQSENINITYTSIRYEHKQAYSQNHQHPDRIV